MITEIHQSHVDSFLRCAMQFFYRHILGEKRPPGIPARRGSGAHKAAEKNHLQKKDTHVDLSAEELSDIAADEYLRLVKYQGVFISKAEAPDKTEEQRLLGIGLDQTVGATRLYAESIAPKIDPAIVEEKITAFLPGWDLPIAGTMDITDHAGHIFDLKTKGKTVRQEWADRQIQPMFYSQLYFEHPGEWPTSFRYQLMIANKEPKYVELVTHRKPSGMKRIEPIVEVMMRCIESGLFPPTHYENWICSSKFCGYYQKCKYGK